MIIKRKAIKLVMQLLSIDTNLLTTEIQERRLQYKICFDFFFWLDTPE